MRKVLKFPLFDPAAPLPSGKGEEEIAVVMPLGAEILEVGVQFEVPQIWALCYAPADGKETRFFRIYATGQEMPEQPGEYRGTFHLKGGSVVAHLFEV